MCSISGEPVPDRQDSSPDYLRDNRTRGYYHRYRQGEPIPFCPHKPGMLQFPVTPPSLESDASCVYGCLSPRTVRIEI